MVKLELGMINTIYWFVIQVIQENMAILVVYYPFPHTAIGDDSNREWAGMVSLGCGTGWAQFANSQYILLSVPKTYKHLQLLQPFLCFELGLSLHSPGPSLTSVCLTGCWVPWRLLFHRVTILPGPDIHILPQEEQPTAPSLGGKLNLPSGSHTWQVNIFYFWDVHGKNINVVFSVAMFDHEKVWPDQHRTSRNIGTCTFFYPDDSIPTSKVPTLSWRFCTTNIYKQKPFISILEDSCGFVQNIIRENVRRNSWFKT